MSEVGGGGGGSTSSSQQFPTSLALAPFILGEAFGLNTRVQKKGGLSFTRGSGDDLFTGQVFSPGGGTFDALRDLTQPIDTRIISGTNLVDAFGNEGLRGAGNAINLFNNTLLPGATELAQTGFRTNIDPFVAQAQQRFRDDFLPTAASQFGSLGLDPGDSDFGAAIARESGRISTELGALDVGLAENAANRRAQGIPLGAELAQGAALLPLNLGRDLFGFEQAAQQAERASSPGGQLMDFINMISGVNTQGQTTGSSNSRAFNFDFNAKFGDPSGGGGGGGAGALAGLFAACHCAALYHGWFTPNWYAARRWIMEGWPNESWLGRAFREFYQRNSEQLAEWASQSPQLYQALRPLFVWAALKGRRA